ASIQLKDVHFSYNENQVLNGLSVEIPAGSHVAVVGPSGAGKSTIFSLLMKFYEDYQGDILIGGHSLSSISAKQVR
ncbi:ATP-binding cassette domain-containing protein, partial [Streptococcus pyogenes]